MATFFVCPICGTHPGDNGTNTTPANNVVNSVSDAVQTSSGVIASTTGTTLIVATGANFTVFPIQLSIPTRGETMVATSKSTNTLTVSRASVLGPNGSILPSGTASGAIALNDVVLTGNDVNGQPTHCPVCGTALQVVDQAGKVLTLTGVAVGSQHPVDVDACYRTQADSPLAQTGTAYTTGSFAARNVITHGQTTSAGFGSTLDAQGEPTAFTSQANSINRGTTNITPETINATVGP